MKLGIMGTGSISETAIKAFKRIEEYTICSIYGHREESISRILSNTELEVLKFTSKEDFINSDLEIVYVATPNTHHYEDAKLALLNKKHVILEKPFVTTELEARSLFEIAQDNNVYIFEAIRTLYSEGYNVVEKNLYKIGKIRYSSMPIHQFSSRYDKFKEGELPNIFNKEFFGGALNDLGVYVLHPATKLFGVPDNILFSQVTLHNRVNGAFNMTLSYANNHICNVSGSKICGIVENSYIHGEDGTIVISSISDFGKIEYHSRDGVVEVLYNNGDAFNDTFYKEFSTIYEIISTKDKYKYYEAKAQTIFVTYLLEKYNK